MKVKVVGRTAIDEPCVCRTCGHKFMTQDAATKVSREGDTIKLIAGLLVCCPVCHSEDVTEQKKQ